MGFDIECIIDIHTYPGEYFCPVCRTLVYPNEALQSQCTHLYCKPCLAHVANNTKACPYDGYLVTEADSKALLEADKVLAENVGKVKVRCLYHRSGCTWQGTLSESSSHCSGCAFGNSPVICNRCGVQIVHRQVHDHAQSCPGVYQAQQAAVQDAATSGTAAATSGTATATTTGDQKQAVSQSVVSTSQAPNPLTTAAQLIPGQDPNMQATANAQASAAAAAATTTPEQWYQQYYQQYAGYDPYHQTYQQYYPYQQQAAQQYQQLQGQYHPQVYSQPQPQAQVQTQVQLQAQPQVQPLPQPQPSYQSQPQPQSQPKPKVQTQSQPQAQAQVPVLGQPQSQSHVQPMAPQYQNMAQVNPQQQFPPPLQPQAQANPTPQSQPYAQAPPHPVQSQPQQYVQMPQYQHPHLQMHTPHVSQSNLQPNRHSQPQPASQHQIQPQAQVPLQPHPQNYPQSHPPQINQPAVPNAQPLPSHPAVPTVTGHQSYQPPLHIPLGAPQQHPAHPYPVTGSLPMHGQIPQQPPLMRPPLSHGPTPNQQQASVAPHVQVPSIPPAYQQQFYPHAPPPGPPVQQRPGVQPIQQPMPQQPQTFPGPIQGQFGHFGQQQPMQSQLRPQGAPPAMQPGSHGYTQSKQNVALAPGIQPQQSQNYVGQPLVPIHGVQPQLFSESSGGFAAAAHDKPVLLASNPAFGNQNYAHRTSIAPGMSDKTAQGQGGVSMLNNGEKEVEVDIADGINSKAAKSGTGMKEDHETQGETGDRSELGERLAKDSDRDALKDGSVEPVIPQKVKEEPTVSSLDVPSVENPLGASSVEDKDTSRFASKELPKQKDMSSGVDKNSQAAPASTSDTDVFDKKDYRSAFMGKDQSQHYANDSLSQHFGHSVYQEKFADPLVSHAKPPSGFPPHLQGPGYAPTALRPPGPEHTLPGQPLNPIEHSQPPLLKQPPDTPFAGFPGPGSTEFRGGPGIFGPPPRNFELNHSAAQRPPLPGVPPGSVDPRNGLMGRVPQQGPEGQFGNRYDGNQLNNQLPGSLERGPFGRPSGIEPNSRMHGPAGLESPALGMRDERFIPRPGEHANPFPMEPLRPFDQAPRPFDKAPHGPNYDGLKSDPGASGPPSRFMPPPYHAGGVNHDAPAERELSVGGHEDYRTRADPTRARPEFLNPDPGFGRHHRDHLTPRSPGGEYFGMPPRAPHPFGEGPGSFNLPLDPVGNSFREDRFQAFSGRLQRIEPDGPENIRFGERVPPGHHNSHLRSGNPFDQDIMPGHLRRGEMLGSRNFHGHFHPGEPAGFGSFPGRGRMEEFGGGFPHHFPGGESFRGNRSSLPYFGEPGFRSSYSLQGFSNDGFYAGDLDPFDKSRKRKPVSMGWCRICKIDCETVDGLDMHSQTREHQRMAMDVVKSIKQQTKKKSKLSGDHAVIEEGSKARNTGFEGRGNKP